MGISAHINSIASFSRTGFHCSEVFDVRAFKILHIGLEERLNRLVSCYVFIKSCTKKYTRSQMNNGTEIRAVPLGCPEGLFNRVLHSTQDLIALPGFDFRR